MLPSRLLKYMIVMEIVFSFYIHVLNYTLFLMFFFIYFVISVNCLFKIRYIMYSIALLIYV